MCHRIGYDIYQKATITITNYQLFIAVTKTWMQQLCI